MSDTKQDKTTGKFKKGHKGPGRPAGSKNKLKIKDVLEDADKFSTEAFTFLLEVMRGAHKTASITTRQAAALKVIELAMKHKVDLDKLEGAVEDLTPKAEQEETPMISLKAVK